MSGTLSRRLIAAFWIVMVVASLSMWWPLVRMAAGSVVP